MSNDVEEVAKATQEVAKTAGKGIDAASKFGGFIAQYIGGSLEQAFGIFEDKLKYMRWERQIRLVQRAEDLMLELGQNGPNRPIPMKLAIPLLQGASLEEDDTLQDLWARLLVNAATNSGIELKRAYIDILERLSPLEATILDRIYNGRSGIHPELECLHKIPHEDGVEAYHPILEEIDLALLNLQQIGCISLILASEGEKVFKTKAWLSPFGKYFLRACTLSESGRT